MQGLLARRFGLIALGVRPEPLIYILQRAGVVLGNCQHPQDVERACRWLRAGVASILSQIVDTLIFITIAFYGVFPIGNLLLGQMLAKVVLSAVLVPWLIYVFVAIGRRLDTAN